MRDVVSRVSLCSDSTGLYSTRAREALARTRANAVSNLGVISTSPFTRVLNQAGFRPPASQGPYPATLAVQAPHLQYIKRLP